MTYLEGSPGNWLLHMCNDVPYGQKISPCIDIFRSAVDTHNPLTADRQAVLHGDDLVVEAAINSTGVVVSSGSKSIFLDPQCTQTLVYSEQLMHNSTREDLTFVLLQFWLLGISVYAIMRDSVPHTLAVLIARGTITAWAAYAIWRTNLNRIQLTDIIFKPGTPCSFDIYPTYFQLRVAYQFFMAVLACLQLECFVLVAAGGLWIDVLVNTAIAKMSPLEHTVVYMGLYILATVGWYAIRREMKRLMIVFLGIAFFLLTSWSIMFYSQVYRWTFMQWPYLGCFTTASLTLIVATIVLGVICRLNFGKGLAQYLHAEAALASSNFAPEVFKHDEEKDSMDLDIKETPATFQGTEEKSYDVPPVLMWKSVPQVLRPVHTYAPPKTTTYQVPYNVPF
ncbi:hypothetical protein C0995_013622 [Termitomyces sp. Mi166|nr:hypothetical protein C0995_013622 [Termitomyces sp. Mi166\